MLSYITAIQLANALLCLLLAAQLLFMPAAQPLPKRLMGVSCLLYAHQTLLLVAILHGEAGELAIMRPLVALWLGPLLYLYFRAAQQPSMPLRWRDLLHFGTATVLFIVLIKSRLFFAAIDLTIMASFILYLLLIALQMRQGKQALQHLGNFASPAYRWLICLMLMALINILAEIAVHLELQSGVALRSSVALFVAGCAFFLLNLGILLAALHRSHSLEWMYMLATLNPAKPFSPEAQQHTAAIMQRFAQLITRDKLYMQEFGITLPQAAKKLQLPARQLSQAINQQYGQSYSVYLNDQRIAEAKRLLLSEPDLPIIEVMQQAGFSTKSNFNKEFLRVVGLSPSAYRAGQ
ncbi:hypothetical protein WG68_12145 [Arsukibacterium ikkense]|uniref:HTH araC/xylS-type domain-containing protein n=1 Tax=Arsukibacterium ikkense TaxID=336831 RepID=A0A0M2V3G5_9GAMM|nr:helix-turn-helix domain-containing protein [Arsukibacterium ikkense]KKO45171.1 hypothetical protein WG68_12145 [Arsukibacterium ikkense]